MRQTTRMVILTAALALAAPVATASADGVGGAGASSGGGVTVLPFAQVSRRCDFGETEYNGPTGSAAVTGSMRSDGNTVTADVQMALAMPGMHYDVRLIQVPRPSSAPCWGGDPGVALGALNIGDNGAAAVTVTEAIQPGATGAWVWITRPDAFKQDPAEFYTTDFIVPI